MNGKNDQRCVIDYIRDNKKAEERGGGERGRVTEKKKKQAAPDFS